MGNSENFDSGPVSPSDVTRLLAAHADGDPDALEQLMPLVYGELRRLADQYLRRERPDHTLGATALVHEAFLRLIDQHSVSWQSRAHFFGIAAQAMRRILVDQARRRTAQKRGRQFQVTLETDPPLADAAPPEEVVAVDEALARLAEADARSARLIELRYFGGLTIEEAATSLGISVATAKRDWAFARAWLQRELSHP